MRLLTCLLLLGAALSVDTATAHDIPLEADITGRPEQQGHTEQQGRLQRLEERLVRLDARLETLTHTVDTQLAQLGSSHLQLVRQLGGSRLAETVAELRETLQSGVAVVIAAESKLVSVLSQEIRQSERQLQTQLNDTQQRLEALLEKWRPSSEPPTTVIVERCSFQDQFQTTDAWRPADCAAVQQRHPASGVYTVFPPVCGNSGGIRVFCDMETDGGGWTVLLRRADVADHQDFGMGWDSYKWGFGNLSGEFWLGNEYVSLLTSMDQMQLRVDLKDWENGSTEATYTPFSVGTEQQKYAIRVGKYQGNAGDALTSYNNMKFSTKDQDNDASSRHCAKQFKNAGWHKSCLSSTLLGPYMRKTMKTAWIGVTWNPWKGNKYSLRNAELKIRPVNYMTWCHRLVKEGIRE